MRVMSPSSEPALAARPAARSGLAVLAATLGANLYLVIGSSVLGLAAIVASWIPPRRRYGFNVARAWARGLLLSSGVRVRVVRRSAQTAPRVVFMANHQSLYDIAAMLATVPVPVRFLAKRSLFRLPFLGWGLAAAGFVPIDRVDRSRAKEAFRHALGALGENVGIVIFPEETRSLDGRIRPFRKGGFLMALKARAPIVPVGIHGTLRVRPKGRLWVEPAEVEVVFGDPIDASSWGVRRVDELLETVEREVSTLARAPRVEGAD
jgi:1-acyl-sn-glycerol-3-phosphate acyltransferase